MQFLSIYQFLSILIFSFSIISVSVPPSLSASDLNPIRAPSTGYQPHFHVSGDKIHYVWHEYDGPFRQIFTAEMNIDGKGWRAEKRTSGQYDKVFPQLQVVENKIYFVHQQPDASENRQIWAMEVNTGGTGWKEVRRTDTPFDKQFAQLQVFGDKTYCSMQADGGERNLWIGSSSIF